MCLATPVKVVKLIKNKSSVEALGKKDLVDTSLLRDVKIGDFLYASRGLAIRKVARKDAEKVLELVKEWDE